MDVWMLRKRWWWRWKMFGLRLHNVLFTKIQFNSIPFSHSIFTILTFSKITKNTAEKRHVRKLQFMVIFLKLLLTTSIRLFLSLFCFVVLRMYRTTHNIYIYRYRWYQKILALFYFHYFFLNSITDTLTAIVLLKMFIFGRNEFYCSF